VSAQALPGLTPQGVGASISPEAGMGTSLFWHCLHQKKFVSETCAC